MSAYIRYFGWLVFKIAIWHLIWHMQVSQWLLLFKYFIWPNYSSENIYEIRRKIGGLALILLIYLTPHQHNYTQKSSMLLTKSNWLMNFNSGKISQLKFSVSKNRYPQSHMVSIIKTSFKEFNLEIPPRRPGEDKSFILCSHTSMSCIYFPFFYDSKFHTLSTSLI